MMLLGFPVSVLLISYVNFPVDSNDETNFTKLKMY